MIHRIKIKFVYRDGQTYLSYVIPISNFSVRIRSGAPSYMQVTISDFDNYISLLNTLTSNITNDHLYLYKKLDNQPWQEILYVNMETIRTYRGSTSASIVLTGHRTFTNTGATVDITEYNYQATGDGAVLRCGLINNIEPADTARITKLGINFVVDTVSINYSNQNIVMELSE